MTIWRDKLCYYGLSTSFTALFAHIQNTEYSMPATRTLPRKWRYSPAMSAYGRDARADFDCWRREWLIDIPLVRPKMLLYFSFDECDIIRRLIAE